MTKDLTRGSPMKLILGFGIPLLFGFLFQQLYNVVDTAIVGKTLGGDALAAVGATGSINFLVVGFVCGICGGFAIPIAQAFGAGDEISLRRYITGSVWLSLFFGIVLTVATVLLCDEILALMDTPQEIFVRSYQYICTIFAGIPAYFLYNMCAGILRSLGNSRTPVIWLMIASVVNIVLDIVFILTFHLDVFGAAFATVLAQYLAGFGCLVHILRNFKMLKPQKGEWQLNLERSLTLCIMGLPMGLQYSITAIGSIWIQSAVNQLGTSFITTVTAGNKVSMFLWCPFDAMGATMATYGGQNAGAKEWGRLHQGLKACSILGIIYSILALLLIYLFGPTLASFFLDDSSMYLLPEIQWYMLVVSAFLIPLAFVNIVRFLIQGMGFSPIATMAGVLEMIGRGIMAALVPVFGFAAAALASPAAWILADLFLIPGYFYCHKKLQKKAEKAEQLQNT